MHVPRRLHEDQNKWNFLLSVLFLLVLAVAVWVVWAKYANFPHGVSVFDALLMTFAAFRVTRLIVYDKITRWFRELFVEKKLVEADGRLWVELHASGWGFLSTIHDLLSCPWCISFWSALIIACIYFLYPWAWFVIFFLALAGMGSLVQLLANMIGWKAENLKQDSLQKEANSKHLVDVASLGK